MGYADSVILAAARQELNSSLCCIDLSVVLIVSLVQIFALGDKTQWIP